MIIRIVKMKFRPEEQENFTALFEKIKSRISGFEGCLDLKLLREKNDPAIFFTYSTWTSEEALSAYRHSAFFAETWKTTKAMFADKAEAWTVLEAG